MGGTTICGFYTTQWDFYLRTWGYINYDRAAVVAKSLLTLYWNRVHKLRTEGTNSSDRQECSTHSSLYEAKT